MSAATPVETDAETLGPLVAGLKQVLRLGLPLRPDTPIGGLLHLKGAIARSVDPNDRLAIIDGLDRLLRAELKHLGLVNLRKPAQTLFGFGSAAGLNLTDRRGRAATQAGYELDHFRKRIEPKICRQLAWQLHQDSLRYVRRGADGKPLATSGPTPTIEADHIERADSAKREALLSRIWSDVYGLRAELIQREASAGDTNQRDVFHEADQNALWYLARLLTRIHEFVEQYGAVVMHGAASYSSESLIRLAGWSGEITPSRARDLRFALSRVGEDDRRGFLHVLAGADSQVQREP
jgi:hypothetical protein